MTIDAEALLRAAEAVLDNAYAPYSNIRVAAALLLSDGTVVPGVNVENASYGLTCCAERTALFSAVTQGRRDIQAIAVVSNRIAPIYPCGACRQVLSELCLPQTPVLMRGDNGGIVARTVGDLLPEGFKLLEPMSR